jgi:hypothetical protein
MNGTYTPLTILTANPNVNIHVLELSSSALVLQASTPDKFLLSGKIQGCSLI